MDVHNCITAAHILLAPDSHMAQPDILDNEMYSMHPQEALWPPEVQGCVILLQRGNNDAIDHPYHMSSLGGQHR